MLDPQIAGLLQLMASSGAPAMSQGTPQQARAGFRMLTVGLRDPASLAQVAEVRDLELPGGLGARVYRPAAEGPLPTVVFFHGGGFVIGDLETHDDHARLLCRDVGAVVLSVDYRLAPEHPWPAGLEDCLAATRWAFDARRRARRRRRAGRGGGRQRRRQPRGRGQPRAARRRAAARRAAAALPATDFEEESTHPSREQNAEGYFLTADDMRWFGEQYVPEGADRRDPRLSVLHAPDLAGLPPAVVATAEYDPLRDEGEAYADALAAAGVPVVKRRYDGLIHGFFGLAPVSPAAAAADRELCADLTQLLGGAAPA